ncbi:MAG: hypothetical protein PUB63_03375, partial [Clostridia bacterium]|nr:hypothetical protein [Clostridia bacterium]
GASKPIRAATVAAVCVMRRELMALFMADTDPFSHWITGAQGLRLLLVLLYRTGKGLSIGRRPQKIKQILRIGRLTAAPSADIVESVLRRNILPKLRGRHGRMGKLKAFLKKS